MHSGILDCVSKLAQPQADIKNVKVIYVQCVSNGLHAYFVQLEIDDGDELTEEFLYDEVHPKQHAHKQAFAKPRGPAGKRGHKRLIKGPGETIQDS